MLPRPARAELLCLERRSGPDPTPSHPVELIASDQLAHGRGDGWERLHLAHRVHQNSVGQLPRVSASTSPERRRPLR
jgi:hypothetical protein